MLLRYVLSFLIQSLGKDNFISTFSTPEDNIGGNYLNENKQNQENANTSSVWGAACFCDVEGCRGTGRHNRAEESMPRGRCVSGSVHCQQHPIYPLLFPFKPVSSHSLLLMGRCTFSGVKYIKCATAQQPQVHHIRCNVFKLLNRNRRNVIRVYGFSTDTAVSLKHIGRILSALFF